MGESQDLTESLSKPLSILIGSLVFYEGFFVFIIQLRTQDSPGLYLAPEDYSNLQRPIGLEMLLYREEVRTVLSCSLPENY